MAEARVIRLRRAGLKEAATGTGCHKQGIRGHYLTGILTR